MDISAWFDVFGVTLGQIMLVASIHGHLFLYKKQFRKVKADISHLKNAIKPKEVAANE